MIIKLKPLLSENYDTGKLSDINHKIWYHGRVVKNSTFSLDYVGKKEAMDQEGPGFYFTNSYKNAMRYAEHRGIILTCKISYRVKKLLTEKSRPLKDVCQQLIWNSPDRDYRLQNWDENPSKAMTIALATYMQNDKAIDAYLTIKNDFYPLGKEYLKIISKFYDGHVVKREGGVLHLIIYNPDLISVIDIHEL